MEYQRIVVYPDDELLLPFDGENFYCPMCGEYPPFYQDGTPAFDWICRCSFFPEKDAGPAEGSNLTQDQYVAAYRKRWLTENGWAPLLVERLRSIFQMGEQDIEVIRLARELK